MSLEAILEAIRMTGEDQVQEIERREQIQTREILAQARQEAQHIEAEACADAAAPAIRERARILQQAHLEVLRLKGEAREVLVDKAIQQALERLTNIRVNQEYPAALHRLTEEALTKLAFSPPEAVKVRLKADPRDRELLEKILLDLGLDLPRSYDLQCSGGLTAQSEDGRIVVMNTLETRMEHAHAYLRRYLATLFEEKLQDAEREQVGAGKND